MDRHERLGALLELLGRHGKLDVETLAAELAVSTATVRRDLDHLAEQQLLIRTRGGAVANGVAYDLPVRYRTGRNAVAKGRIARAAAELVERGSVIGINGGTTTTEVARSLALRSDLASMGDDVAFTVVTNALNIANDLVPRPQVKIVVTGGVARRKTFELAGQLAARILDDLTLDLLFLGVDAIDPAFGACAHNEDEAGINRLMVERASRVVVVADSSKLGAGAFARICPIGAIDTLVTDDGAPADLVRRFQDEGVVVTVV
ncbi:MULTISPECIES: DeoR/GlpR family DNA-binding transcription regulator [Pseudonocardiaceae]|uniref:DeoR family transcriptional regulator n=3 Tax=Pseudonocardiaceae TaxID=2070 RepID=A0A076MYG3_AMYME|nr:DeoR/GlpR family DNA-binding transcription regulator [Amycolatopsis methanolica]AIJ26209.1 DeoR family transcriptional regulator [Amycolatopsis methanolica 239]